ncbi:MAG TPA: hypothetical protein VGI39_18860, partial [Polyangiaceae bacterium]
MSFEKGTLVDDRYRLEERLGAGAFGEVWKAAQVVEGQDFGRACAIKLMRLGATGIGSGSARSLAGGWLEEVRNLVRVKAE